MIFHHSYYRLRKPQSNVRGGGGALFLPLAMAFASLALARQKATPPTAQIPLPGATHCHRIGAGQLAPYNADLLAALRGDRPAETTGEDNLKTAQLVFSSYESACSGKVIFLSSREIENIPG